MDNETPVRDWQKERDDARNMLILRYRELYQGIAKHLPGWDVAIKANEEHICYMFKLICPATGQNIDLNIQDREQRIHVSGNWPKYYPVNKPDEATWTSPRDLPGDLRNLPSPSINVGMGKSHEVMARDIMRRFMKPYTDLWVALMEMIARRQEYENKRLTNWQAICQSPIVRPHTHSHRDRDSHKGDIRFKAVPHDYSAGYGSVEMSGDDSVNITLNSLPIATAQRILKALEGLTNGNTETSKE